MSSRMDSTGRDEEFFSDFWMADLPGDLELHLALQDEHEFIGRMGEVFPPLSGCIDPEVATNPRFSQEAATCSRSMVPITSTAFGYTEPEDHNDDPGNQPPVSIDWILIISDRLPCVCGLTSPVDSRRLGLSLV